MTSDRLFGTKADQVIVDEIAGMRTTVFEEEASRYAESARWAVTRLR